MEEARFYPVDIDDIRRDELGRLQGVTYLDHVGAALYSDRQLESYFEELKSQLFANPHSRNSSSHYTTDVIDQVRTRILHHFNTKNDEYTVIFTSGCTAALKLVGDCFQWRSNVEENRYDDTTIVAHRQVNFCYLEDNHTSVVGIRELAINQRVTITCIKVDAIESAIRSNSNIKCDQIEFHDVKNSPYALCSDESMKNVHCHQISNNLFVYPAQSNFSGRKYPLPWIEKIQNGQLIPTWVENMEDDRWFVLLDAASYVSTAELDLDKYKPDFVPISFYKLFGFPTGLGALIVRNSAARVLQKHYFGGGTIETCLYHDNFKSFKKMLTDRFEDGTIPFLDIIALKHGFDCLARITGGMRAVCNHTYSIVRYAYQHMVKLCHYNGKPLCIFYCDGDFSNSVTQGPVINFNILDSKGDIIGYSRVSKLAELYKIILRTGCFCNLGHCQKALGISSDQLVKNFQSGHVCGDDIDLIDGKPTGSIRISFGYSSSFEDADRLVTFLEECFIESPIYDDSKIKNTDENYVLSEQPNQFSVDCISVVKQIDSVPKLHRILLYPVKSCGAFEVDTWPMGPRGLLYDRTWMIINESGVCLSLKQEPKLYDIRPKINLEEKILVLEYKGIAPLKIPLCCEKLDDQYVNASICQSRVCGDKVIGTDCGDEAAKWLSGLLNKSVRLFKQHDDSKRITKWDSRNHDNQKSYLSLANAGQLLIISSTSVQVLYELLKRKSDEQSFSQLASVDTLCDRFRANLILKGGEAFAEDRWKSITINDCCTVDIIGPCTRCHIICIDPVTKVKNKSPLTALMELRGSKVHFGVLASARAAVDCFDDKVAWISCNDIISTFEN